LVLAGMLGFGLARTFGVALVAYLLVYLMRRLYDPLYLAWISQHTESDVRATVLSVAGQVDAAGQIAGGPLFGLIATAVSTGAAIVAAGFSLAPALLLYRLTLGHVRAAGEREASGLAGAEG
jgi:DHA3 family tetracycline resistance protein-like MFS transporter